METGMSALEALKSLTHDLSDKEARRWLRRHKDEMESAKQDLGFGKRSLINVGKTLLKKRNLLIFQKEKVSGLI